MGKERKEEAMEEQAGYSSESTGGRNGEWRERGRIKGIMGYDSETTGVSTGE